MFPKITFKHTFIVHLIVILGNISNFFKDKNFHILEILKTLPKATTKRTLNI